MMVCSTTSVAGLRFAILAVLVAVTAAQSGARLPPKNSIPPAPLTSLRNPICDVVQGPMYLDVNTCELINWGGNVTLSSGQFVGTTYLHLDNTKLTNMSVSISSMSVTLANPVAPLVPGFFAVGAGFCTSLAAAQACLGGANVAYGATNLFNTSGCGGCLPGSLLTVVLPYSYIDSTFVATNSSSPSFKLSRNLMSPYEWTSSSDKNWTLVGGQLMLFIGSFSDEVVEVSVTATATMAWRNASPLPPASPGSDTLAAGHLSAALSVSMLLAFAVALLMSFA